MGVYVFVHACVYVCVCVPVCLRVYVFVRDLCSSLYICVNPEVIGSIPAKTQKTENSDLHGIEVHRPSSKGTKLLLQVIKAIIKKIIHDMTDILHTGRTLKKSRLNWA